MILKQSCMSNRSTTIKDILQNCDHPPNFANLLTVSININYYNVQFSKNVVKLIVEDITKSIRRPIYRYNEVIP